MLAASIVVLALNSRTAMFEPTPIGYFTAAIQEKNVEAKCDLIESGLACMFRIDADKNGDELNRMFTLYLGFLTADLPFHINCTIGMASCMLPLSLETRALAVEALDGYLRKLKASKEDVPIPVRSGLTTGIGHGQKPSEWLEGQYVSRLREGLLVERVLRWVSGGERRIPAIPLPWR